MKLAESLYRNIMEATVGGIINKFKAKSRRNVLFFEEIIARYIKECEEAGYGKNMEEIGRKCSRVGTTVLIPDVLKKIPISILFNTFVKRIWINMGYMDDLHAVRANNEIKIKIKNEGTTRIIGRNRFIIGFYIGVLNALTNSHITCVSYSQNKRISSYCFKIGKKDFFKIKTRERGEYGKLNYLPPVKGFTLKDAIRKKIFQLNKKNRIFFHKKSLIPLESTVFHLMAEENILPEKIPHISYQYFKETSSKNISGSKKLLLLKTLLQVMGWGIVKIAIKDRKDVLVEITNPPYGLQAKKDNWNFFIQTILGYLWTINRSFKIKEIKILHKKIVIKFIDTNNRYFLN